MTTPPPAGWYPDTTTPGQQRWWDGARWTSHTTPLAPTSAGHPGPRLASFGQRLAAAVLDALVLTVPLLAVAAGTFLALIAGTRTALDAAGTTDGAAAGGLAVGGFAVFALLMLVGVVAPLLYGVGFEGSPRGQTVGKWALGIRVVDGATAGRLAPGRALVRVLLRSFVSGSLFGIGYLWMLWDEQNRTLHDLAADSRVVVTSGPRASFGQLLRSWTLRG